MVSSCSPSITCRKISSREAPGGSGKAWVSGKQRLGHWGLAMSSSTVLIKRVTPVPPLTESKSFCWYDLHVHWLLAMILVSGFFASEQKRSMGSSESWNWDWNWNYRGGIRSKSGGTLAKIGDSTSTDQTYVSPFQWQVWGYTVAAIPAFQTHLFSIHVSPHWTLLEGGHLFWTVPHTRDLLLQWLQDHWSPKADLKIIFSGFLVSVFTWRSQINRKQKSTSK